MMSIHIASDPVRRFPGFSSGGRRGAVREVATRMFYFSLIVIAFVFALILTTGSHH